MHAQIFQRTSQGQAATCGRAPLDSQALHLLMRFNGYTALEYLEQSGDEVEESPRLAQQLLELGLIEQVGEDPVALSRPVRGSCWGCLDSLVPT